MHWVFEDRFGEKSDVCLKTILKDGLFEKFTLSQMAKEEVKAHLATKPLRKRSTTKHGVA
ncbi:hypothetical protein [Marinobacter sp. BSs20148]|jgi:hypothetical protein|uniref:hypothetical protein n=1 Tax=Marinobacter sp. BSs20148 TaxID=490759 RepID=UPI0002776936|nr:hypothetical protein [Marinobacter sp. BSs20148]AFP30284.1 hypothetical protein MRBBS_1346 [Marinobacter sp. BSs20148]